MIIITDSAKAYRPPGMRGREPVTKIHEFELPSNQKKAAETEKQQLSKNQKRKLAKVGFIILYIAKISVINRLTQV